MQNKTLILINKTNSQRKINNGSSCQQRGPVGGRPIDLLIGMQEQYLAIRFCSHLPSLTQADKKKNYVFLFYHYVEKFELASAVKHISIQD
jgi:hypothetical protein